MVHNVRSIYGLETISPTSVSLRPSLIIGPTISSAEIYWELTLPGISSFPPFSLSPRILNGGYPSSLTYSIFAPNFRRPSTRILIGLCCMRSVPVSVCVSPAFSDKYAVMNRMAVPAALISIISGISFKAFTITSVSSQLERLLGSIKVSPEAS